MTRIPVKFTILFTHKNKSPLFLINHKRKGHQREIKRGLNNITLANLNCKINPKISVTSATWAWNEIFKRDFSD
jgi:hypothetical protein